MPTPSCCDRLTLRVVLLKVSPLVARLISVPDDLSLEEIFRDRLIALSAGKLPDDMWDYPKTTET